MADLMGPAPSPGPAAGSTTGPGRAPRIEPRPDLSSATFVSTPRGDAPPAGRVPAPTAAPASPEVIEVRARPAALWQRITAFVVDGALVGGVLALYVGLAAALITPRGIPATQLTGIDGVMARVHQLHAVLAPCVALALVLGLVYAATFALLWNGRTPGRRLLGIRLVDRTGLAPAPGRAIARAALAVVSFVPFLAGFWLALFDRRGQTLHDKLTQTFVVRPG
ncbi:MAG TPA: RDD family protein [Myxococcaceae bacterium]|nr:RDD family protein [Myxococcaceae bacterium]